MPNLESTSDIPAISPSGTPLTVKIIQGHGFPRLGILKKKGRFLVSVTIDNTSRITALSEEGVDPKWNETLNGLVAQTSSALVVGVYAKRTILKNKFIGGFEITDVLGLTHSEEHLTRIVHAFGQRSTLRTVSLDLVVTRQSTPLLSGPHSPITMIGSTSNADTEPEAGAAFDLFPFTQTALTSTGAPGIDEASPEASQAREALDAMQTCPEIIENIGSTIDTVKAAFGELSAFSETWKSVWDKVGACVQLVDGIAEIHPYASIAWSVLSFVPRALSVQATRDRNIIELLAAIDDAYSFVQQAVNLKNREEPLVIYQNKVLADIMRQTTECAYFILDYAKDSSFWKRATKNAVISEADARTQEYLRKLKELKEAFENRAVLNTEISVLRVMDITRDIANDIKEHDMDSKLNAIPYAGAHFQWDRRCLPGTRKAFLEKIEEWVNDPNDSHRVSIIFGLAGTGKSSIAHETAHRFEKLKRLGSSFRFDRADQASRRPQRLFSNIARDLAHCDPCFKQTLCRTMRDGTYLRHLDDPSWQLENLILQPIKDLRVVGPLVIVIDALDESGDEHARRGMLALLTAKISEFPSYFRILMTSRPEPDIVTIFQSFGGSTHLFYMDDSTLAAETTQDILGYIRFQRDGSNAQFRKFLNEDRCRKLRDRSEGLFQWASVACSYLTGSVGGLTIADLFDNIVKQSTDAASLDTLYTQVLRQHFNMSSARVNKRFKSVMGYVLAAFEPLSISSLAEMQTPGDDDTTDPHETVNAVVGHMGALLSGIHDHSSPIRPLHTSFRDCLVDIQRSSYFYVNPETYHSNLASACLRILNTHLKFNMAGLETSYSLNENIPNLEARTRRCLPSHVAYACRFWATHLQHSTFDEGICDQVRCFLFEKLLFWLEALSLLREVSTAASGLTYAIQWTEGHNSVEDLQEMARDAVNFVRQFGTCIAQSTPHLYLSALPFSPETSHIIKHYGSRFRRIPRVGKGRAAVWPACEMVLTPHCSSINAVTFSPDGHRIAFGCDDGTVGLVSAETGEAIGGYLQGHKARVLSVAFSPNGRHIISGSDDTTVRIWCAETHEVIGVLKGHTRSIMSVAFSPDGRHIVSGSRDMTIRLWTTHMGEAIGVPLKDHKAEVLSVAFSPDGRRIISGSTDATVRLWDVVTGETVMIISCKSSDFYGALSVAFSLDRSRCVVSDAGLFEHDVGMWSLETGKAIGSPLMLDDRHPVSVAFSPDGLLVVVGSENCNVRLWDPKMRESWMMHPRWKGHMGAVTSVAFSPDGRRIVSGSRDQTIRLWKSNFGKIMPMQDHRPGQRDFRLIVSIAFSPDGRYIASGSVRGGNNTMDLWSTQTGDAIGAPQKVFRGVRSLAFSPDGSHIVFVSDYHYDRTVRLWCIDTGNLVICSPPVENCKFFKSVAFSQDGGHVILTFHQNICMWNTETMEVISILPPKAMALAESRSDIVQTAVSPDCRRVAFQIDNATLQLWSMETDEAIGAPLGPRIPEIYIESFSIAFSPDSCRIVLGSGDSDRAIYLWNAETSEAICEPMKGHKGRVTSVAFSSDGNRIVSGSCDGIRLWNAETGETIGAPTKSTESGFVYSIAFSPEGHRIVTGSEEGRTLSGPAIRIWNVETIEGSILLSLNPEHALIKPDAFLGSLPTSDKYDYSDLLTMQENGWLVGPESRLLLWLPSENRQSVDFLQGFANIDWPTTSLDLSKYAHGTNWHECYTEYSDDVDE